MLVTYDLLVISNYRIVTLVTAPLAQASTQVGIYRHAPHHIRGVFVTGYGSRAFPILFPVFGDETRAVAWQWVGAV